jgi:hypothetical protein
MNTNGLAKHYAHLSPKERLPLILAASARGDEAERNRLAYSAPTVDYRRPDYYGLAEGMLLACKFHLLEMLDMAAFYWEISGLLGEWEALTDEGEQKPPYLLYTTVAASAYLFVTKLDGWRRFCSEFPCDSEQLMKGLPGFATVKRTEESARLRACTREEATLWIREEGNKSAETLTVETVAASFWAFVNDRSGWWG